MQTGLWRGPAEPAGEEERCSGPSGRPPGRASARGTEQVLGREHPELARPSGRRPARTLPPASLQPSDSPRPNQNAGSRLPGPRRPMMVRAREKGVKPGGTIILEGEGFKVPVLGTGPSAGTRSGGPRTTWARPKSPSPPLLRILERGGTLRHGPGCAQCLLLGRVSSTLAHEAAPHLPSSRLHPLTPPAVGPWAWDPLASNPPSSGNAKRRCGGDEAPRIWDR